MAESQSNSEESEDVQKLHKMYLTGWNLYDEIEESSLPTNSTEFQGKVQNAMNSFEAVTRIVSSAGMFSANELIDEVPTDCLQFLLLPYFLGKLTTKLKNQDVEKLSIAEIYFKDFLQRCQEYGLCELPKPIEKDSSESELPATKEKQIDILRQAAVGRNEKIAQYNKMKELNNYVKSYKEAVQSKVIDDEVKRKFFLKFIEKSIIESKQELDSVKVMKEMETMRRQRMAAGDELVKRSGGAEPTFDEANMMRQGHGNAHQHFKQGNAPKPMQPFIITRNAAQKAVFGLGYPSMPVMSIEDFYDQRVREGLFPDPHKVSEVNNAETQAAQSTEDEEEIEKAQVEQQIEEDNEDYLTRTRRMDEYKDSVRRGDGNRYNRS